MSKNKAIRMTMGGILLATAVTAGVSLYKTEQNPSKEQTTTAQSTETIEKKILEMPEDTSQTAAADDTTKGTSAENDMTQTVETSTDEVTADTEAKEETDTKDAQAKDPSAKEETKAVSAAVPQFSVNSTVSWPVNGTIVMDYSMDKTVYFPTLNVYKCNPAVLLRAKAGDPVKAACAGTVKECFTSVETGDTVTVSLGNGYEAVYGQLKDVCVKEGDKITGGETIATVADPTRYYKQEGTHVYFAMTKDGNPVDPADFTEREAE